MSRLEETAKRVLTPFILGKKGFIEGADVGPISAWALKTCFTAMYVSTAKDRAAGYGLPASEYRQLYEIRDLKVPLPDSQFWIGRFDGTMAWSVRATPLVIVADAMPAMPEPEFPQGYLMTIVLGQLLLQGVRMTTPGLGLTVGTKQHMPRIWPGVIKARWPKGDSVDDISYQAVALGRDLQVRKRHTSLHPWKPATDLPVSGLVGDMIELPTICGKHVAHYPSILVNEAMHGRFYAFIVSCDCGVSYLIHTEQDGAHCKASGDRRDIAALNDQLTGTEAGPIQDHFP